MQPVAARPEQVHQGGQAGDAGRRPAPVGAAGVPLVGRQQQRDRDQENEDTDLEEVLGISDRIAVMREGAIAGTLTRDQFSEEAVMGLAFGRNPTAHATVSV